jgi:hypothetical protein
MAHEWRNHERRGLRLTFADSGSGILAKDLPRILDPFLQRKDLPVTVWDCHSSRTPCKSTMECFACAAARQRAIAGPLLPYSCPARSGDALLFLAKDKFQVNLSPPLIHFF